MRRGKLRRSLSVNSSLDIRNHVMIEFEKNAAAEPEFRWDQFDKTKQQQPVPLSDDEDEDVVPPRPLSNKKVTRTTSGRGSGAGGRIPKPSMISRATSAPVQQQSSGTTFFSWDQYQSLNNKKGSTHSSSSSPSPAQRPRSPTPTRTIARAQSVSILKQSRYPVSSPATSPACEDDNDEVFCWENYQPTRHSTGSKNLLARGRALMQREESKSLDDADDSLNASSEHSSVSFRNSIKVFEIPKYCDKKIKQDFFYTKKEIKIFKAEKKEEKRERKRQSRSLSPKRTSSASLAA